MSLPPGPRMPAAVQMAEWVLRPIPYITNRDIAQWPVGEPFPLRLRTQAITLEIIMRAVFGINEADRLAQLRDRLSPMLDMGTNQLAMVGIAFPVMRRTLGKRV